MGKGLLTELVSDVYRRQLTKAGNNEYIRNLQAARELELSCPGISVGLNFFQDAWLMSGVFSGNSGSSAGLCPFQVALLVLGYL